MEEIREVLATLEGARVVMVVGALVLAGAERQALALARQLKGRGARPTVVGLAQPESMCDACDAAGIPWQLVPVPHGAHPANAPAVVRFVRALRRLAPDVLLPYYRQPNVLCGLTWRLTGARACVWNQRDAGLGLRGRALEHAAVALTSAFVSNSRHGAAFLARTYGVAPSRLSVIPNAVELGEIREARPALRARLGIGEGDPVAVMVAHLTQRQDHETVVRAWGELARDATPPWLLLVGRPEDTADDVRRLTRELGVGVRVRLLGEQKDVASLLAASDLAVFAARGAGLPNGVLEPMASGLPVVATEDEGTREALGEGADAQLVPAGDARAMADAVATTLRDTALRERRGRANRERVERELSAEALGARTAALLTELLGQARAKR